MPLVIFALLVGVAIGGAAAANDDVPARYFDNSGRVDALAGGSRRIPIDTPAGRFEVWVKRIGNNPRLKLLILHGGPAMGHEYLEAVDSYLPGAGVEYYHYAQLGSWLADQPDDDRLWHIERFVDELEQVRVALGLDASNFVLLGHSWGGMLAMEYALTHPDKLKGLVVSNMMASIPAYNRYAREVLMPQMDPAALAEIQGLEAAGKTDDPRYMALMMREHYVHHVLRLPPEQWPDPVMRTFAHMNHHVYVTMQGPSELGLSGTLENWDRSSDLARLTMPTLVIGARYDTMDPAYMEWMAGQMPRGRYLFCPQGSHLAMYDDQQTYFDGLLAFLHDLESASTARGKASRP
ncbi:MAG: proline iminopeptidase-family hydrolase [Gammaproteobacteria bacterium]|nr:proline iminopeptidase-family hydrolase [Gammaproteobacteria bacterium]